MKTLGVYTKDFSLYYDILKILKKRKISYRREILGIQNLALVARLGRLQLNI